eukprot:CAMPEP_0197649336 /NCGR_PEP_ID=MMETSP1338-20131121/28292_1 /TAXON_ID=43686 ORGANISM="Pelagodinium beii, Strain RCC1491" /NCGR_SAMPLE_ID=MMETSP1338 /ASSEMBLY_ACC=CAM_ASM_000754 /LENGTH=442 /DNA_ID=CAMNT_0043223493 /DNA_START=44 /DNA_END=1373 /DNA_ORIENTATION=+
MSCAMNALALMLAGASASRPLTKPLALLQMGFSRWYDKLDGSKISDVDGYDIIGPWSEVCGKGCSTPGMTCIRESMAAAECAQRCNELDECVAFQMPADNGFHGWCVWFDYKVMEDPTNTHLCHDNNYVYEKLSQEVTATSISCTVGDTAVCPYSGVSCRGNQCCPGSNETGGLNFVCPSAESYGPWAGQYPPRCQLLSKVEDCLFEATAVQSSPTWVGCYSDDVSRDFREGPSSGEDYTFGYGYSTFSCAEACRGYAFMALQNNGECRCGGRYASAPQYQRLPDAECGEACVTEQHLTPKRFCGGQWSNAVYALDWQLPTQQTTSTTTASIGQSCNFRVSFCNLWTSPSTSPPAENWELMIGQCTPNDHDGAYMATQPSSFADGPPSCGITSPYYVEVKHFADANCSVEPNSSFIVFTDGNAAMAAVTFLQGSATMAAAAT